jgi:hypothetical protein
VFSLADVGRARRPIDLTVELTDADGTVARRPLSRQAPLEPEFTSRHLKIGAWQPGTAGEPVFQTFAVGLGDLASADPSFDPARIRSIRFVFDRTRSGQILLDDVGRRPTSLRDGG